jgi:hypothetical protein
MISSLIALDPTTITITRHTKTDDHGTDKWTTADLDPITVRIYNVNTHNQREYRMDEGEIKESLYSLMAESGSDIVVGHNSFDTFIWNSREFRIIGVRTYTDSNIPEHMQADCVAI